MLIHGFLKSIEPTLRIDGALANAGDDLYLARHGFPLLLHAR